MPTLRSRNIVAHGFCPMIFSTLLTVTVEKYEQLKHLHMQYCVCTIESLLLRKYSATLSQCNIFIYFQIVHFSLFGGP